MDGSQRNLYLAATVACMTAALFGYSVGFIGGVLVLPSFLRHFELDKLEPHELLRAQGTTVTSWLVGTLVGVLLGMPVYSKLGRKRCLLFSAMLYTFGATMQVSGIGGILMFDLGRVVNGVGVGAGTLVSPLYISEISTPESRGMLMSGYQVSLQLSALIGFWAAYVANQTFDASSSLQFQVPVALQLVPGVLLILGTFFIPEAPRFLAEKGESPVLEETVAWLRGLVKEDIKVTREVEQIWRSLETTRRIDAISHKTFFQEIRTTPSLRRRLFVGIGLMIAQNLVGLNAINYYSPSVFRSAGFTTVTSMLFLTGLFGLIKLIAAVAFMFVFVRVRGNRFWLNLSSAVCAVSMFVLTLCIWLMPANDDNRNSSGSVSAEGLISVLAVYAFAFAFSVGLGPISWNVCGEIFPPALSAKCCTITTLTQWLFQIVIAGVTPRLIESIKEGTYVVYGVCCLLSLAWCWYFVPETRGVRLGPDMDRLFEKDTDTKRYPSTAGLWEDAENAVDANDASGTAGPTGHAEEAMDEVTERTALLGTMGTRPIKGGAHRRSSVALVV